MIPAPRANPHLIGHSDAESVLVNVARSGRLPHAWLFCGPKGVGKATLAFRFARWLLAGGKSAALALPPDHPTFARVAASGHADLMTVERVAEEGKKPLRDLPVDLVRKVGPFLRLTAAESGWRVVIVDDADRMNRNAANAILKILEEPPSRSVIILIASNPGMMLPTIRSRCRRIDLAPLSAAAMTQWLQENLPELNAEDTALMAFLAKGAPGEARALHEAGALAHYRTLLGICAALPELDLGEILRVAERLAPAGADQAYESFTRLMISWLERLVSGLARGEPGPDTPEAEAAIARRMAEAGNLDRWLALWEKTRALFERSERANLDRKYTIVESFLALQATARA